MVRLNCWEFIKCGKEPNGSHLDDENGVCPAALPGKYDRYNRGLHQGRICWNVPDTLCEGHILGSCLSRLPRCMNCDFMKKVREEEDYFFMLLPPATT